MEEWQINVMKKYFLIFRLAILDAFEYRINLFLHVFKYGFFTALTAMIWVAVAHYSTTSPMPIDDIVVYYLLAAITYSLTSFHLSYVETDISLGRVSIMLLKPISAFYHYFSFQFGLSVLEALLRACILFFIIIFYFPSIIIGFTNILSFAMVMLFAYTFCFTSFYCFSLFAFWLQHVGSIRMSYLFVLRLLSGFVVPFAFFPMWIQNILYYTPFPHLVDHPIKILLGQIPVIPSLQILSFWILVVYCIYRLIWHYAQKAYESVGG